MEKTGGVIKEGIFIEREFGEEIVARNITLEQVKEALKKLTSKGENNGMV